MARAVSLAARSRTLLSPAIRPPRAPRDVALEEERCRTPSIIDGTTKADRWAVGLAISLA